MLDPAEPEAELKLRGRVVAVADEALRNATAAPLQSASGRRPDPEWHFFALDRDDAAHIAWRDGVMTITL